MFFRETMIWIGGAPGVGLIVRGLVIGSSVVGIPGCR